jgi:hypothetical protein
LSKPIQSKLPAHESHQSIVKELSFVLLVKFLSLILGKLDFLLQNYVEVVLDDFVDFLEGVRMF